MGRARQSAQIAVDTSVVRNFFAAGQLPRLIAFLPGAIAVQEVLDELEYQGRSRPVLASTLQRTRWPDLLPATLTVEERRDVQRIQREWTEEDSKRTPGRTSAPDAHLGEIVTVFAAVREGIAAVLLDDGRGRALAGSRGLHVTSGAGLAIRLTHGGELSSDEGWAVYDRSLRSATRAEFERLVSEYRA